MVTIQLQNLNSNIMSDTNKTPVNPGQVFGNWSDKKNKLKEKYPTLTDSDLRYETGKKDEMLARVHEKLGKTREELDTIIAKL